MGIGPQSLGKSGMKEGVHACGSPLTKRGLWDNIHAKRKRIAKGSGEKMRKPGSKGAPSAKALKESQSQWLLKERSQLVGKVMQLRVRKNLLAVERHEVAKQEWLTTVLRKNNLL